MENNVIKNNNLSNLRNNINTPPPINPNNLIFKGIKIKINNTIKINKEIKNKIKLIE